MALNVVSNAPVPMTKLLIALMMVLPMTILPARAAKSRIDAGLIRLDPDTRLEQVCDLYAMNRIAKDSNPYHPDRAKSDVVTPPQHAGDTMTGTGGAFRSGGHWYQYAFTCKASPDHMKVLSFSYKLGEMIPESKWASYGLWR